MARRVRALVQRNGPVRWLNVESEGERIEELISVDSIEFTEDDDLSHIYNGRFESGIDGWQDNANGSLISRETDDPISGTGSLKVTIDSDSGGSGPYQRIQLFSLSDQDGHGQRYWGQTWELTFEHRGNDVELMVLLDYNAAPGSTEILYCTAIAETAVESIEFTIPGSLVAYMDLYIATNWNGDPQNGATYVLDNIILKRIS